MAGPQCCELPPPRDHPPVGVGRLDAFHDLTAYVTGSPEAKVAVILISDVFVFEYGYRKLADKVAEAGYYVVVPDYFNGDPYVPDQSNIQDWLKNHSPEKGFEDSIKIIEVLKSRGISSIGAGGFCWGAKVVVELAKGEDLKAGVLLHPSRVTVDDIKAVKVPMAILGAEIDRSTPPELVKQFEVILSEKSEVDSFVNIYPGVAHGWTVRYDETDETAVANAEVAHKKMLEWFKQYVV
ncbi:endo-1,3;1,4-beta-D-glucanase isoform X2 [Cryptomeria japonica]|uniref:endo-1,3;1,4-beta-D-glucanase isoform X2 n=1 Tax=Cryptomeria japonica TaxID=3369 RepID=UPI0025AC76F8|nr:endo-1,3;1,4-beta-D-glucanase isoform X2 [Cryptomeria japonica]